MGKSKWILLFFALSVAYFFYVKKERESLAYAVTTLFQTGPEKQGLKTVVLAEALGLSADKPVSLYAFDLKEGREKLLALPFIEKAGLERLPPNALVVDYTLRSPVAYLADYENRAIDRGGHIFPVDPYLRPKKMAQVYLGLKPLHEVKQPLENPLWTMALEIIPFFERRAWEEGLFLKRIDLSNVLADSLGKREIILYTEESLFVHKTECIFPKIIRLSVVNWERQLLSFFALRKKLLQTYEQTLLQTSLKEGKTVFAERVVDLRLPQLAFIQNQ